MTDHGVARAKIKLGKAPMVSASGKRPPASWPHYYARRRDPRDRSPDARRHRAAVSHDGGVIRRAKPHSTTSPSRPAAASDVSPDPLFRMSQASPGARVRYISASAARPSKEAASAAHRQNAGLHPNSSATATRSVSAEWSSSGLDSLPILSAGREHAARKEAARATHEAAVSEAFACCT